MGGVCYASARMPHHATCCLPRCSPVESGRLRSTSRRSCVAIVTSGDSTLANKPQRPPSWCLVAAT
eukprot:scaffold27790_cov70-Phaeocystis_antarctica.AAC.3